ncbi:MAG: 2Fe-2S iron-sulfur cluster-binding protein [Acidipropionibacterium sp.]|jgi:ferredoxin|nr:2Fe-2S iron-sulfur cluster-binding protein [Acidipropionibacterium sp.]
MSAATWTHSLTTADGAHLDLRSGAGESIIEAAEDAGMLLPSSCRAGNCGACHARAVGDYELGDHASTVLDDDAAGRGEVLLCRTYAHGPLTIALPYEQGRIISGRIPERTAVVTAVTEAAADTIRLDLTLEADENGAGCEFDPGQFLELTIPGTASRRSYSLANTPNWDGLARFFIKLRAGGEFSRVPAQGRTRAEAGGSRAPGRLRAPRYRNPAALVHRRGHRSVTAAVDAGANGRVGRAAVEPSVVRGAHRG